MKMEMASESRVRRRRWVRRESRMKGMERDRGLNLPNFFLMKSSPKSPAVFVINEWISERPSRISGVAPPDSTRMSCLVDLNTSASLRAPEEHRLYACPHLGKRYQSPILIRRGSTSGEETAVSYGLISEHGTVNLSSHFQWSPPSGDSGRLFWVLVIVNLLGRNWWCSSWE